MGEKCTVIGLMSGTSIDGVDAALVVTDGETVFARGQFCHIEYPDDFRARLRESLERAAAAGEKIKDSFFEALEKDLTEWHARAVALVLEENGKRAGDIDLIGFHGQTLFHAPEQKFTWQLGNGAMLARMTGIDVVGDFRSHDMKHGGEGAPFLPLYHRALFRDRAIDAPVAVLNIGGVSNVTWLFGDKILAFDCGPGNALMDDFVAKREGAAFDEGGKLAGQGTVNKTILTAWINHPYFCAIPPKSLDRNDFKVEQLEALSTKDGLATLAAFTIEAISKSTNHFEAPPQTWLVTGGGRHNDYLMERLGKKLAADFTPIEEAGSNGDSIEAEGFAYLAVRSVRGLPLSVPGTTGIDKPRSGGNLFTH